MKDKKKEPQFVHLHTHSHYSLLDGLSQIGPLVDEAKKLGMPALALTDHGNMYGAVEFYKKCNKAEIKPIIGVEAYIANRTHKDKETGIDNRRFHLTLLAETGKGYKNLLDLVSTSHLEGFYYKPRMDHDLLRKHSEGLIALSGCYGGEFMKALRRDDIDEAKRIALMYQGIFGKKNYFIEIMHHPGIEGLMEAREKAIKIAKELDIPLVATADSHYLHIGDKDGHETLLAIQTDNTMSDGNRLSMSDDHFNFITAKQAAEYFKDVPEAVENTVKIAERCNAEIELGTWYFPDYKIPEGTTYDSELRRVTYEGIKSRGLEETKDVTERIDYELGIIKQKGYAPYFLVVADLLRFATENDIYTNIRGSVAGSIVTYLTGITKVNPLEYKLPFERFLNPERPSAPDIDMDFADNRRDEVIEYAKEKYGEEKVAQIGTFGTMLARGVVRDVARALGKPYAVGDRISKNIPPGSQGFPMTIERALKIEPDLKKMYNSEPEVKEIIDLGKKLEGCVRHVGVHAAGVVIAPTRLEDFTPIQLDPRGGKKITQYDMYTIEDAGLLKFDFLGIRNLAILADAVDRVHKIRDIDIDIEAIPLDDEKTFKMLARGETMGLFQLGGAAMTRHLMELKPSTIHDINAMVALYRPGPMEMIPEYIRRKHNPQLISYLDPRLKDILDQSYGVITYQDDVLLIAINLAGYSWLEADQLRKAMGKKIPELMEEQKNKLIKGFIDHGKISGKLAEKLWHLIEPFAAYGFNKAHAASYGRVAYQTSYMKANYPAEYMTAVLTAESGDVAEVAKVIDECKRMGFTILPPDINESFSDFTVVRTADGKVTDNIRFGLRSIKNFGEEIGKIIIRERKTNGPYRSLSDFLSRIKHKNLNKKSLEALAMCGALDSLGERGQIVEGLESALEFHREVMRAAENDQASLFGDASEAPVATFDLPKADEASLADKLRWEKELLGLYISGHPLETHKEKFEQHDQSIEKIKTLPEGSQVVAAGLLAEAKSLITKRGDKMMFGRLEDFTDSIELVIFPDAYRASSELLEEDNCIALRGTVSHRNGTPSIILERAKAL